MSNYLNKPDHSVLPPSSAARRAKCPGSRKLEEMFPSAPTLQSQEGVDAHENLAIYLETGIFPQNIDNEAYNAILTFKKYLNEFYDGAKLHIEEKIDISVVHPDCYGTADVWHLAKNGEELHVWDFKYGHSYVDAVENFQLLEYALGILEKIKKTIFYTPANIFLHIVQPRCYAVPTQHRVWKLFILEILGVYLPRLIEIEKLAMQDDAPTVAGPQCLNCSARAQCPTVSKMVSKIVEFTGENTPVEMSGEALSNELRLLNLADKVLKARISGLTAQTEIRLKNGDNIPYFSLDSVSSSRRWCLAPENIATIGDNYGIDLRKKTEVITPTQALKLGIPKEHIENISKVIPGVLKVVQEH